MSTMRFLMMFCPALWTAEVAGSDFELTYDTGLINPDTGNPALPEPGVSTRLVIGVVNNTGEDFPIGGIVFDFEAPSGGLLWDLDGEDDEQFTWDDGFTWHCWLSGVLPPNIDFPTYWGTVDPPQTVLLFGDLSAIHVPAEGSFDVATLLVQGTNVGEFPFRVGGDSTLLYGGDAAAFAMVPVGGTHVTTISVLPEPGPLPLAMLGAWLGSRRRRRRQ
jgi:hypothetical protein